jgi:hypothetical protein
MEALAGVEVQQHRFLTSKLDGVCGQLYAPTASLSNKESLVPPEQEAGRSPESVWTHWKRKTFLTLAWNRTTIPVTSSQ